MAIPTRSPQNEVGARLSHFHSAWERFLPPNLCTFLRRGYHWEWKDRPPKLSWPRLSIQKEEVQQQVQRLLDVGAIYEVEEQPCFLSRIFVIPKQPTGSRLILDVSDLNEYLSVPSFTMSNHATLSRCLQAPAWMASLDLKDAYLHVPIRNNLHKFLALSCWGKLFFFKALPFGLAPAPWLFSLLIEKALTALRSEGINILGYIDDLVLWNSDKDELQAHVLRTMTFLRSLGLTINKEKSFPSPTSSLSWVGVVWNAKAGTWSPQQRLLERLASTASSLLESKRGSRRQWEGLCGLAAFAAQINRRARHLLHPLSRLELFDHHTDRDRVVDFHPRLLKAVVPWTRVSLWLQPQSFQTPVRTSQCWTDASMAGWGVLGEAGQAWQGRWTQDQSLWHINVLELLTILYGVRLLNLRKQTLVVWSDNQTAIRVIQRQGSRSPDLQKLAGLLLEECEQKGLLLFPRHIKGAINVAADALSRENIVPSEWELSQDSFRDLVKQHGTTLQVDLFASPLNNKLPVFCSPFQHPLAWATDALAQDWNRFQQVLLFPPPTLAKEVAKKLLSYRGGGSVGPSGQRGTPPMLSQEVLGQGTVLRPSAAETSGGHHPGIRGVRTLSRVEFMRAFYRRTYEDKVVEDLLRFHADSSLNQYDSAWKNFQRWLSPSCTTIDQALVASYLVDCNQKFAPRTVLTHRAALILPLGEVFGIDFEHKHFSMLAKSSFRAKPPEPKIVPSWSLDDALLALEIRVLRPSDRLGRLYKALFLTALASSNRASELAAIDRSRVAFRQSSVVLPVRAGFIFKNQTQHHSPSLIEFPDLPGSFLCPVKALRKYLDDSLDSTEAGLFLHPVSGKTLNAGRLAFFLAKAIDWLVPGSMAKGHDTRKLSTTHAWYTGVRADQIVAAGSWKSTSTFANRYLVPLRPSSACKVVLARNRL